jgi:hypothetical protein
VDCAGRRAAAKKRTARALMEALNDISLGWFIDFVMGFCKFS